MNIKEQHVVAGMTTDMNVSRFDATKVLYARNIRITQMEDNQGLLCVTNEKGTKEYSITGDALVGNTVGSAELNGYLVLFTHSNSTDYIYRLESPTESSFTSVKLFEGNLGLSEEHPLETLSLYENDKIQKVYWVDGVHQLRCINIVDTSERPNQISSTSGENTVFDSNAVIDLTHLYSVEKRNSGGEFPAGTIQYAFTYYNLNGPETNVFETTPLYELSPKNKGVAADGRTTCSFRITISNLDDNFDYVRVYAITRTSANATPNVRIVGDYKSTERTMYIIDNGSIGETVDATKLLFIGGEPVAPATFTAKDNTLFLGNIKLQRPSLYNIPFGDDSTVGETIDSMRANNKLPLVNAGYSNSEGGSGDWFYDYTINNNRPSTTLRRFKRGETYRLGIIAQHETGIWSDVLWLGDYENDIVPEFYNKIQKSGCFRLYKKLYGQDDTDLSDVFIALEDAGFVRIAPVVVYPEGTDRTVFCQGLVSATVYNVEDRFSNRPFSQASWFFRPIAERVGVAALPHCTLHNVQISANRGAAELQLNTNPRNFLPQVEGFWGESGTKQRIPASDMVSMFGNDYYVDTSIVTLNSPDIELDDSLQQEDFDGLKFRIVGVAKSGTQNIVSDTYTDISAGYFPNSRAIDMSLSRLTFFENISMYAMSNYPSYPGYLFNRNWKASGDNLVDIYVPFILYPWHKTGCIMGKYKDWMTDTEEPAFESSVLNRKVMSSIWFAHTEIFENLTNVDAESIKLFDDTQSDFIPLGETADSPVYYGNVDSVRIYKKDSLSEANSSHYSEVFNMSEPVMGASHDVTLDDTTRKPNTDDEYVLMQSPAFTSSGSASFAGIASAPLEEMMLKYGYFRVENTGSYTNAVYSDNAPVPIKYKSTKHVVIPLAHAQYEIPSLYRCEALFDAYNGASGQETKVHPFWDESNEYTMSEGKIPFATEWPDEFLYNVNWSAPKDSYKSLHSEIPTLYIGELYREVSASTRFGGSTKEALHKNIWKQCGKAMCIADITTSPSTSGAGNNTGLIGRLDGTIEEQSGNYTLSKSLSFVEGDTYLTRYDCLKTYPYADNDVNSIVEIFSTDLETRVNLDARYDNARGLIDNTLINPTNINLVNRLGFEQENNFFTFTSADDVREDISGFPNLISISSEKTLGEDVDSWMQHNLTSTQDLEGIYGEIEALRTFNNDVFVFQNNAFGQILFNSRVQIPTSDGQPIEITNGMKLQGVRYLSNKIGCSNKWSIALSNSKMYWFDQGTQDIWSFSGQGIDNLSTRLGVKGFVSNFPKGKWSVKDITNLRTLHDEKYNDVYFIIGNEASERQGALVYSESLDTFVSVMDYTKLEQMYNLDGRTFVIPKTGIHALWEGNYNTFFGENKPYILRFIANAQPNMHKVFDTVQWRSDTWDSNNKYLPRETFNKLQAWNQYQQTAVTTLNDIPGKPSPLKKKFNTFRALVPRDKFGDTLTDNDYTYKKFSRIRGNYAVVELTHDIEDTNKMQFYDLEISEFL